MIGNLVFNFIQEYAPQMPLYHIAFFDIVIIFPIIGLFLLIVDLRRQSSRGSRRALITELLLILSSMAIRYIVTEDTTEGIKTSSEGVVTIRVLTFLVCLFAIVRSKIKFFFTPSKHAKLYLTFFGASIMWFSSFTPDLIALAKRAYRGTISQYLEDTVLGGAGLRNGLFIYGFLAFVTLISFYLLLEVSMRTLNLLGFNELHKEIQKL